MDSAELLGALSMPLAMLRQEFPEGTPQEQAMVHRMQTLFALAATLTQIAHEMERQLGEEDEKDSLVMAVAVNELVVKHQERLDEGWVQMFNRDPLRTRRWVGRAQAAADALAERNPEKLAAYYNQQAEEARLLRVPLKDEMDKLADQLESRFTMLAEATPRQLANECKLTAEDAWGMLWAECRRQSGFERLEAMAAASLALIDSSGRLRMDLPYGNISPVEKAAEMVAGMADQMRTVSSLPGVFGPAPDPWRQERENQLKEMLSGVIRSMDASMDQMFKAGRTPIGPLTTLVEDLLVYAAAPLSFMGCDKELGAMLMALSEIDPHKAALHAIRPEAREQMTQRARSLVEFMDGEEAALSGLVDATSRELATNYRHFVGQTPIEWIIDTRSKVGQLVEAGEFRLAGLQMKWLAEHLLEQIERGCGENNHGLANASRRAQLYLETAGTPEYYQQFIGDVDIKSRLSGFLQEQEQQVQQIGIVILA